MIDSRAHRKSVMSEKGRHLPKLFDCMSALLLHCTIVSVLPRSENQRVWSSFIIMLSVLLSTFLPKTESHISGRHLLFKFILKFKIEVWQVNENVS